LFSTTGKSKEKTELVILITPHIITGDNMTQEAKTYIKKWDEKQKLWGKEEIKVKSVHREQAKAAAPYETYYAIVRGEAEDMARRQNVGGLKGEVDVQFILDKDGFLVRQPRVINEPDVRLAESAVDCIKLLSPFPPFPEDLVRDEAIFLVTLSYD